MGEEELSLKLVNCLLMGKIMANNADTIRWHSRGCRLRHLIILCCLPQLMFGKKILLHAFSVSRLPYNALVGGVFSIRREHFQMVNGYSNLYWGWGAEDDDMYNR